MTRQEGWDFAREVVQQVANQQSGAMPDEDDPFTIDADTLMRIVFELLEAFGMVPDEE